jgi:AcrR family transcriptional regulator
MATKKTKQELDINTEAKIKNAARVVFHKKGFAATRTRDIAEEAGINLALLNYYFRSKEKLFDIIMMETMQGFFQSMATVFNDDTTTLEKKVETIAERYIDLLIAQPDIPIFLLNELRNNPTGIGEQFNMKQIIMSSVIFKQWQIAMKESKLEIHPLHFMINLMSLVMFPFVGSPILKMLGDLKQDQFNKMMLERKALIPKWIKAMMKAK